VPGDTITYAGGSGASASVILGLTSASFNVSYGGNYTQAASGPNISISSSNGVGSGATAVPITDSNNDITGIDVTNPGYGYTAAPIITITATGTYTPAVVTGTTTGFGVVGIQETSAGDGYSSSSAPTVNSANGSGLQLNSPVVSSLILQSTSNIGGTGDIAVSAIVSGSGGLTKIGSDTVTLSSINTYSGGTNISAGTLAVPNPSGLGTNSVQLSGGTLGLTAPETISNSLTATTGVSGISVVVAAGATAANLSGGLTVQSGATVKLIATGSVSEPRAAFIIPSFSDSGTLDILNNAVDLPGASIGTISPLVGQGFNGGNWHGTGITSSTAANDSTHLTAVGVIVNDNGSGTPLYGPGGTISSTFDGAASSDGDILVKYTYFGDANLDGVVNGSDYSRIDNGYLQHLTGWYNGDFNYDNVINGSDYTLMDNAFNTQGASLAASIAAPIAFATAQIAGPASSVPEPTVLGLLGLATFGLLGRRPRR
jgi:autotransporter-associated beta strand protein